MPELHIDEERCIQCGDCAADCPYLCLTMDSGLPAFAEGRAELCIGCQHCLAVCPTAALSIDGKHPDHSAPVDGLPDAEQMESLIRARRSTRKYTAEPVDKATIDHMLDVLAHAPTGVNSRSTRFTVVDDPAVMDAVRKDFYAELRRSMDADALPAGLEFFADFTTLWEDKGVDVLFRGAPHLLVTSAAKDAPSGPADCVIALSYFELLAASMGLGTVWDGLAKWAMTAIAPQLTKRLGIPNDHDLGYVMAFGHPDVQYHRATQRDQDDVHRVTG